MIGMVKYLLMFTLGVLVILLLLGILFTMFGDISGIDEVESTLEKVSKKGRK